MNLFNTIMAAMSQARRANALDVELGRAQERLRVIGILRRHILSTDDRAALEALADLAKEVGPMDARRIFSYDSRKTL